jgi:serine/threonine protein kinase
VRAMSLQSLLEIVRRRGGTIPEPLAAHLLCASVNRAAVAKVPVRPGLIFLDPTQGLLLDSTRSPAPSEPTQQGYLAPEALTGRVSPCSPGVLVYAAGALGYELLTGKAPPPPPVPPGPELNRPLGAVIRVALAPSPADRFPGLDEMGRALQAAHPNLAPEFEKHLFAALLALCSRWTPESAPSQLRKPDTSEEGGEKSNGLPRVVLGIRRLDAAVEQLQQQQFELTVSLIANGALGSPPPAKVHNGQVEKLQEQLLQRNTVMSPAAAPAAQSRQRGVPWMSWGGGMAAGVLGALLVSVLGQLRSPQPSPPSATSMPAEPPVPVAPERPISPPPRSDQWGLDELRRLGADLAAASSEVEQQPAMVAKPMMLEDHRAPDPDQGPAAIASPADASPAPPAGARRGAESSRPVANASRAGGPKAPRSRTQALLDSGERALRQGRAPDALAAFQAAVAADPQLAKGFRGIGMACMILGQEKEAAENFKQYLRLSPHADDAARIRKVIENLNADESK